MNDRESEDMPKSEKITKLEGAERNLKTAIQLFFDNGDMLSVHALVAGAHEVLHTLLLKSGIKASLIKDNPTIRKEKLKEFRSLMNRTQNFLKHADTDPHDTLKYYEAETPFWIHDAIRMHKILLKASDSRTFLIFEIWFLREYPTIFGDEAKEDTIRALKFRYPTSREQLGEILKNPDKYPVSGYN